MEPEDAEPKFVDPNERLRSLGVDAENGLRLTEAQNRLKTYGPNSLPSSDREGFFRTLLKQISEPMILLLIVIGIIYFLIGTKTEAISVVLIVLAVIFIEFYSVRKAQVSIRALKSLVSAKCWVIREGVITEIPVSLIVPGDVVYLHTGNRIPADGIILDEIGLEVDESPLTGESYPVRKEGLDEISDVKSDPDLYRVISGTLVVQGSGKFAATETGLHTEIGKISESIREVEEPETPLEESLNRTARFLVLLAIFFSFLIPLLGYLNGNALDTMILTGLSMAFATVPEEVPVLITITLAIGAYSLAKNNAIVKNLKAAQTLGNVTVVATDKTGTITENSMQVNHIICAGKLYSAEEKVSPDFLKTAILSTGTLSLERKIPGVYKDPMEISIFKYSKSVGVDPHALDLKFIPVDEFAFDNKLKLASYLYRSDGDYFAYVSGAPESVLSRSSHYISDSGEELVISDVFKSSVIQTIDSLASSGERAMGVAYRKINKIRVNRSEVETDLVFCGVVSFLDPPRKDVKQAIHACQKAGIRVVMLTGDHPKTAAAIGRMVGIPEGKEVVTGDLIRTMSDEQLAEKIEETSIFSRITHDEKLRIVRVLQKEGEVVAVTGDGVNDAPALRAAEIGIAMGLRGTEVAKEASDMVLQDDDFMTIAAATFEGRKMQDTLRKGLRYYISVKISLILILLVPIILLIPFPFYPIQIIIMELFMDVGALWGFLYEKIEISALHRPPEGRISEFFDRKMQLSIGLSVIGVFLAVTLVYLYAYYVDKDVSQAQTAAFATWILSQVILAMNLRTENEPITRKGLTSNPVILAWSMIIVGFLILVTLFVPLHHIIDTSTLGYEEWLLIIIASILSSSWMEVSKILRHRKERASANEERVSEDLVTPES